MPVVEADPSDEALRRSLLGMIEHAGLRAQMAHGPLKRIEQLIVASDPVAYEEWFAKQPKPQFPPMDLPDSIKADIEEVTKHNPPWMRGQYLSYYRPPVPAHLFAQDYANDAAPAPETPPAAPAAPAPAIPSLRARIARLLDRTAPRLPEELDLAEAICAIKWPKWPDYRGPIDLGAAAPRAGRRGHRRADPQLARRQGDRAGMPGGGHRILTLGGALAALAGRR